MTDLVVIKTGHEIAQAINRFFSNKNPTLSEKRLANLACETKWANLEDLTDTINSRIMWLKDTAPNGTPPYADLRVEELENILAILIQSSKDQEPTK